jgi:hypothetical protein
VLAGLEDGRIARVDPETLDLTELVKLPSGPRWIGWGRAVGERPAGLVVVTRQTKPPQRDDQRREVPYSVVHDLGTGKTYALEEEATAFLLDPRARLWLGVDRGEWGGGVTRVDLLQGTVKALKPRLPDAPGNFFSDGVYGFVALRDGQVWALGGTVHMGLGSAAITRVDEAAPHPLYARQHFFWVLDEARNREHLGGDLRLRRLGAPVASRHKRVGRGFTRAPVRARPGGGSLAHSGWRRDREGDRW